jgi:hypothetical protein
MAYYHGNGQTWGMQGRERWLFEWEIDLSMRHECHGRGHALAWRARCVRGIGFTTGLQPGTATGPRTIVRHDYYTWRTREHPQRVPCRGSRQAHRVRQLGAVLLLLRTIARRRRTGARGAEGGSKVQVPRLAGHITILDSSAGRP